MNLLECTLGFPIGFSWFVSPLLEPDWVMAIVTFAIGSNCRWCCSWISFIAQQLICSVVSRNERESPTAQMLGWGNFQSGGPLTMFSIHPFCRLQSLQENNRTEHNNAPRAWVIKIVAIPVCAKTYLCCTIHIHIDMNMRIYTYIHPYNPCVHIYVICTCT